MSEQAQPTSSAEAQPTATTTPPAAEAQPKVEATPAKEGEGQTNQADPVKETPAQDKPLELKLPDGSRLEQNAIEEITKLAKEKGWTQEQAQEFLNGKHEAVEGFFANQQNKLSELNDKTWKEELVADADVGGARFEESGVLAHKAAVQWFGQEFADLLKTNKLNHHPQLFRGLVKIAKAGRSDEFVIADRSAGTKPIEEVFYGKAQ